jgi:hypothetical protein
LPIGGIRRYRMRDQPHRELALPCQAPSAPCLELPPANGGQSTESFCYSGSKKKSGGELWFTLAIARIPRAFLFPCRSS